MWSASSGISAKFGDFSRSWCFQASSLVGQVQVPTKIRINSCCQVQVCVTPLSHHLPVTTASSCSLQHRAGSDLGTLRTSHCCASRSCWPPPAQCWRSCRSCCCLPWWSLCPSCLPTTSPETTRMRQTWKSFLLFALSQSWRWEHLAHPQADLLLQPGQRGWDTQILPA